jgi:hypothetical protein
MKASANPLICGVALAAMLAAGATHWWSVHQLVSGQLPYATGIAATPPVAQPVTAQPQTQPPAMAPAAAAVTPPPAAPAPAVDDSQREFFKSLLDELKAVRKQNQELHDQVAETNRDLMELQFRVDTHSESFRPLKVTSEAGTLQNELSGVLPPKALPAE